MASAEVVILVVDDELTIVENLTEALKDAGYAARSADSGKEAMDLLESTTHAFRALITDVNMPGDVTGWALAHRAREINPALPVVYMTGAAGYEWSANGVPESILLTKPFALAQVVAAITQLINAASSVLPPIGAKP